MARVRVLTPTTLGGLHRFSIGKTPCSEDWQKNNFTGKHHPKFFPTRVQLKGLANDAKTNTDRVDPKIKLAKQFWCLHDTCENHQQKSAWCHHKTLAYHQILGRRHKAESVSLQTGNSLVVLKSGKVW